MCIGAYNFFFGIFFLESFISLAQMKDSNFLLSYFIKWESWRGLRDPDIDFYKLFL